ncbi:MAG: DUF2249 domain-containing protein [Gammaproteobacteria bacterium]|nr:DUF2249 domain-containing protein [Gammaproteobacteria bacterium]
MEHLLDVSELEPCEPMERVLTALQTLQRGDSLKVMHRREPRLLYPILAEQGFRWSVQGGEGTQFVIRIWHSEESGPAVSDG